MTLRTVVHTFQSRPMLGVFLAGTACLVISLPESALAQNEVPRFDVVRTCTQTAKIIEEDETSDSFALFFRGCWLTEQSAYDAIRWRSKDISPEIFDQCVSRTQKMAELAEKEASYDQLATCLYVEFKPMASPMASDLPLPRNEDFAFE